MHWTEGFSPDLLDVLVNVGEVEDFHDGDCLIRVGDCETHLFYVLSGNVRVDTAPAPRLSKRGIFSGKWPFSTTGPGRPLPGR